MPLLLHTHRLVLSCERYQHYQHMNPTRKQTQPVRITHGMQRQPPFILAFKRRASPGSVGRCGVPGENSRRSWCQKQITCMYTEWVCTVIAPLNASLLIASCSNIDYKASMEPRSIHILVGRVTQSALYTFDILTLVSLRPISELDENNNTQLKYRKTSGPIEWNCTITSRSQGTNAGLVPQTCVLTKAQKTSSELFPDCHPAG